MVDVGDKPKSKRVAIASCQIKMERGTLVTIMEGTSKKGDVLGVARLAESWTKQTANLIPLPDLGLDHIKLDLETDPTIPIKISATCSVEGSTGVEMEAMVAAQQQH